MATIKGGDKLKAHLADMKKRLGNARLVRVGFLENATYPNGTPVAMVAAIQEYGAPKVGIPARSYFRTMVAAKSPGWPKAMGASLKAGNDARTTLELMGDGIKGQLQQSITDLVSPPLSPVTLMLRKMKSENQTLVVNRTVVNEARRRVAAGESTAGVSTKPLVDSGHFLDSANYEVK